MRKIILLFFAIATIATSMQAQFVLDYGAGQKIRSNKLFFTQTENGQWYLGTDRGAASYPLSRVVSVEIDDSPVVPGEPTYATGVMISPASLKITAGDLETLAATVTPSNLNLANKEFHWISSDTTIVDLFPANREYECCIHGIRPGRATISVVIGNAHAECIVEVTGNDPVQESCTPTGTISGAISHTQHVEGTETTVTVSCLPQSIEAFKRLREQIGKEPQGAVALTVIGIAMYSQFGQAIGEPCIEMCNDDLGYTSYWRARLKEWYVDGRNDPRSYQAAAFIVGATPENGYNPRKPYVMSMYVAKTAYATSSSGGTQITLRLRYTGSESSKDISVTVLETSGGYYVVHANPSMYSKVKEIVRGQIYNGL